jgi:hypothetical protein
MGLSPLDPATGSENCHLYAVQSPRVGEKKRCEDSDLASLKDPE